MNVIKRRANAIYKIDDNQNIRRSHENPYIQKLYRDFLGKPGSKLAHKLLHTKYSKKDFY